MIFRTRLKAGLPNVFNKAGKYFYLLTAADAVEIRFRDANPQTNSVDFKSEMREGMSADFEIGVTEVELLSQSDQYVEFWLGKTKLDYSRLALGGASSQIDSGRAVCELGSSLAIPADFRRKAITLQALADVTIGGIGVTAATGYALKAGESIKLNSRGDVYTYLTPARVNSVDSAVTYAPVLAAAHSSDPNGYQHVDRLLNFFFEPKTGNLVTGYGRMVYSTDSGATWNDSQVDLVLNQDPTNYFYELGQTTEALYIIKGYYGRIGVSYDGGVTWNYLCGVRGSVDKSGNVINGCGSSYGGWVSGDGKNIIVIANDGLWETHDAGASWENLSSEGYTNLWGSGIAVLKSAGITYVSTKGGLWAFDYQLNKFIQKQIGQTGGGEDSIAAIGSQIYWHNSSTQRIYYSHDGGDTIADEYIPFGQTYIKQYGESVLIGSKDKLGVIRQFGDAITWVTPATLAGKNLGDRIAVTANSIIVKQSLNNEDIDPKAAVYPMAALAGARLPVPLQWLAELN
ncbi:hypothetical protein JGK44_000698 [Shewanella algae]|nr:hypothetical protein [Shewanella algae]